MSPEPKPTRAAKLAALDAERMRSIAHWTARTLETDSPVPFGADIFHTKSGTRLMRATNAVGKEHDPSAHAEVRTVRLACRKLKGFSLQGYTMYTTCEPCPMCMSATRCGPGWTGSSMARRSKMQIAICNQIQIPAIEVASRSGYGMQCRRRPGAARGTLPMLSLLIPTCMRAMRTWSSKRTLAKKRTEASNCNIAFKEQRHTRNRSRRRGESTGCTSHDVTWQRDCLKLLPTRRANIDCNLQMVDRLSR